ncbi:MAG: hypothetical protein WDW38_005982 [Sanguina aurantia]
MGAVQQHQRLLLTLSQRYAFLFSLVPFAVAVAMHSMHLLSLGLIIAAGITVINLILTLAACFDGHSSYWPHALDISLAAFFAVMLGTQYSGLFDKDLQQRYFVIMITGWLAVATLISIFAMPDNRETVIVVEYAVVFGLLLLTTMLTRVQPLGPASGFTQLKVDENSQAPPVLQDTVGSRATSLGSGSRTRGSDPSPPAAKVPGSSEPSEAKAGPYQSPV